jgi:hypothetical protein
VQPACVSEIGVEVQQYPWYPRYFSLYFYDNQRIFWNFVHITDITVQSTIKSAKTAPSEGYSSAHVFKP